MKKPKLPNIPEFSDKNYKLAGYVVGTLITLTGAFFLYEVFADGDLTFKANWNMFKSPLGSICLFIGFIWAMLWWGKFTHWSSTPVTEYRDKYGNVLGREENMDVMEQSFAKILMPILGHFVIEPIMYGAVIYYPIQCIIALVGSIFPYILALIVLAIIAMSWLFTREVSVRYHSVALVVLGLLFTVAFAWGGIAIKNAGPGATIQMAGDLQQIEGDEFVENDASSVDDEGFTTENQDGENTSNDVFEEEEDDQFEGVGEEGLYGALPEGTTAFEGKMDGYPINFNITKNSDSGEIVAMYKNVNAGTIMRMEGESLPAMGGNIAFYGKDGDDEWQFYLGGDADNITGTASCGDKQLQVTLHR